MLFQDETSNEFRTVRVMCILDCDKRKRAVKSGSFFKVCDIHRNQLEETPQGV